MNCLGPLHREWILGLGCCSSSRSSIGNVLSGPGGAASVLVVGGAAEAIHSQSNKLKLVLKSRKGFVKLAIKHGADLGKIIKKIMINFFLQFLHFLLERQIFITK